MIDRALRVQVMQFVEVMTKPNAPLTRFQLDVGGVGGVVAGGA